MGFRGPLQPAGTSWSHLPQRSSSGLCRLGAQVSSLDGPFSIPPTPLAPQHLFSSLLSPISCLKPPEWPCPGEPLAPTSRHLDRQGLLLNKMFSKPKGHMSYCENFPKKHILFLPGGMPLLWVTCVPRPCLILLNAAETDWYLRWAWSVFAGKNSKSGHFFLSVLVICRQITLARGLRDKT